MGRYWKRRYYQNQRELRKQRKRVKILLALTVSIVVIFGSLLLVGYAGKQIEDTGKQIQDTATDAVDSIYILIFGWISDNQSWIVGILIFGFFALILLSWIWPRNESSGVSHGGY
jgi:TRAP-type C4-dicarboxylate transport system permease small subunit